jgi:hypothetical protein
MEQDRINLFQGMKSDGNYSRNYDDFIKQYFSNESTVRDLWNKLINNGEYTKPINEFYTKYACDLTWAKQTTYCGGTGSTTTPGSNVYACIEAAHPSGRAYTTGKTQLHITRAGGILHIFKNDYNFTYKLGTLYHWGTWACDGTNNYKITLKNGQTYSSKDHKWSEVPKGGTTNPPAPTTGDGLTSTTLTGNDLASGSTVKVGMRGDIVTKIQELLIAKGFTHVSKNDSPDGIFGNRTKRMVMAFQAANGLEDDGVVGKNTWAKLSDGTAATNSSTNQATSVKDPFEVPGSDSSIMQESRKKILRKYLQEFK